MIEMMQLSSSSAIMNSDVLCRAHRPENYDQPVAQDPDTIIIELSSYGGEALAAVVQVKDLLIAINTLTDHEVMLVR